MDRSALPIGFMDSGVGGLAVMKHAVDIFPHEDYVFYGDNKNAPYGEKSEEQILECSLACGEWLNNYGVKAIVVACNTATSVSVRTLREQYSVPVISIEPAVKPAMASDGDIIVMATPATIAQSRYQNLVERLGCKNRVVNIMCGGLADLVEKGDFASPEIEEYIASRFALYKGRKVGGIVIGCTHYSFVSDMISRLAKENFSGECAIYDGMYGAVRQMGRVLEDEGLLNSQKTQGTIKLFTSGDDSHITVFRGVLGI